MLEVLGVDPESETVYAALLDGQAVAADELARTIGFPPTRVRAALRRLQSCGLVGRHHGPPATYVAIDPEVALDALLLGRQEQLHKARVRAGSSPSVSAGRRPTGTRPRSSRSSQARRPCSSGATK